MIFKSFAIVLFASTISLAVCDTRTIYQAQPQNQNQPLPYSQNAHNFYEPLPSNSVAAPRNGGVGLWDYFEQLSFQTIVEPVVFGVGLIVGVFGFFQITNWLFDLLALQRAKNVKSETLDKKKTAEESNEVDAARRRRMISTEVR